MKCTKKIISLVLVIVLLISAFLTVRLNPLVQLSSPKTIFTDDFKGWYLPLNESDFVPVQLDSPLNLSEKQKTSISISIPSTGKYYILITYYTATDIILKSTLTVNISGQECMSEITSLWRDETQGYPKDEFGNEIPARQTTVSSRIIDVIRDQSCVACRPFIFDLQAGNTDLELVSNDCELQISRIALVPQNDIPQTADYRKALNKFSDSKSTYIIEAEKCSFKSNSAIRATCVRDPALSPYEANVKRENVLDAASFNTVGQKVQYVFDVSENGIYNISFRYSQDYKEDFPAYRNILIDSHLLCSGFQSVGFDYTGKNYSNTTVDDKDGAIGVYLTKGRHTITLEADGTPVSQILSRLSEIMKELSEIGVEIKKVSGGDANKYRTWDIDDYFPDLIARLKKLHNDLDEIYEQLGSFQVKNSAVALNTKLAADNISALLKNKNKIPGNLKLLNEGSGSATQFLADQIDKLTYQNLSIDRIYVHSPSYKLPSATANFGKAFSSGLKRLLYAAFSKDTQSNETKDSRMLDIWVNRSIQYVDTLQALTNSRFTEESGIKTRISVMSSEQRIILANASGSAPDVIMGVGSGTPFDLGIRGAVVDLNTFPDFSNYITREYNTQSLVPYVLENSIYGVTETQEFYVLMMRKDILEQLGIMPPQTWDDVANIMPVLRRNSMNFYLQLSGYTGTKPLYSTVPFLIQSGGEIYSKDGLSTAIQSNAAYNGFKTLTDLYRLFSIQKTVSSFYNSFRYGQIPIGIASFSDYVKIKNAAPEITGLWQIALSPGFISENGNINRGTTGASTACAIMKSSKYKNDAWKFLKWWLSSETQVEYGNTMQMTYGADYLWNTANINAFKQLAFPEEDKRVILEQWNQMNEVYRHPALYAVERELSNAWSKVVIDGVPARIALDNAASEINHEFERKLQEFDYIGENSNKIKDFSYCSVDDIIQKGNKSK